MMTRAQVLIHAVRCAIKNGCDRKAINVAAWASTYKVPAKTVREVWEAEMTKVPPSFENGSEGK
jgi:hypothetical protein